MSNNNQVTEGATFTVGGVKFTVRRVYTLCGRKVADCAREGAEIDTFGVPAVIGFMKSEPAEMAA